VRSIRDQIVIPRQRQKRFDPPRELPKLNRLHTFFLGAVAGGAITLLFWPSGEPMQPTEREEFAIYGPPIVEPIAPPAPAGHEGELRPNQFIADVLTNAGASAVEADRAVAALKGIFDFRTARPGQRYRIEVDNAGNILFFEFRAGPAEVYQVARKNDSLVGEKIAIEQDKEVVEVRGTIDSSLFEAFVGAGESEALAMKFAEMFRFDVDFFHETQKGDSFRIFVEKPGNKLMAAEYRGAAGTKRLFEFDGAYFDEKGTASQRAFLKSPLSFTRISSGFGYRHHPVHGGRHFHGGVDYAAPIGTPVHAIGEGTVTFAGRRGASGNLITIRHPGGIESYYLHLSKLNVRRGQRVSQSTVIGKVGTTGRSTGPHLDFRIKKSGRYLDPSKQVAPRQKTIAPADRARFEQTIAPWQNLLADLPASS
jgi:murein DD-endopeptidase MepM/ murein hydrolase activator NlpD